MKKKGLDTPSISPWFYRLCRVLARLGGRLLFGLESTRAPALDHIKGGLLIIGNHQSYADPVLMATAFPERMIHFVAGRYLFERKWVRRMFTRLGVIAKEQMRPDARTIRDLIMLARRGETLFMFPEGQRSVDGRTNKVQSSTGRFVKKLGLPVAAVRIHGAYLCWPRWGTGGLHRGKITQEAELLFTSEEIRSLSAGEIDERIERAIFVDEYAEQLARRTPHVYKGRHRAERLDAILHWCPACQTPFQLKSEGDHLACRRCDLRVLVEATGLLKPETNTARYLPPSPSDWHERQIQQWHDYVQESEFQFEAAVSGNGEPGQRVIVKVTAEGFMLNYENGDAKQISHDGTPALFAEYGQFFRFFHLGHPVTVRPDNGQAVIAVLDLILSGYVRKT